ncbi:MAG: transposase [Anaerolineae bacterium]
MVAPTHHRHTIRLRGYDYAHEGAYFVTVVTQERACLFGGVRDGVICASEAGVMVARWWDELAQKYPTTDPDAFIVMPNHCHGVIVFHDGASDEGGPGPAAAEEGRPHRVAPTEGLHAGRGDTLAHVPSPVGATLCGRPPEAHQGGRTPTLAAVVGWCKTMTTNEYVRRVREGDWPPFAGRLWQRNYYERVIRNQREYEAICRYIADNPANWPQDAENPTR